jgi:two-component system chemotaxis response regulator CheY
VKTALIVDDATTVRMFVRHVLEKAGFAVAEAVNGLEGLERALAAPQPPDLFVVDVNMPRMNGYAFLRAIRGEPSLRAIPAIVMSTESQSQDAERAYEAGANLYLIKPGRPETLTAIARVLAGFDREGAAKGSAP